MVVRRKSASSRKRRRPAREAKGVRVALDTVGVADRRYSVMPELFVVSHAVAGSELGDPTVSGLRMLLRRQIDEIRSLKGTIQPWTPPIPEETAS